MPLNISMELTLLLFLLLKHAVVDIGLQRHQGQLFKANYRSKRAQYHYIPHGIGTFVAFIFFTGPITAIIAGILDWLAHWQIDFLKSSAVKHLKIVPQSKQWWWLTTVDQILHYLTYYLIILLV